MKILREIDFTKFLNFAGKMTGGPKLQTMQLKKPINDEEFHSIFPVENEELVYGRWEDEVIWDHEKMNVKLAVSFFVFL